MVFLFIIFANTISDAWQDLNNFLYTKEIKTSYIFLRITGDAKQKALGNGGTGYLTGISATSINPAGLAFADGLGISSTINFHFLGINTGGFGLADSYKNHHFGINFRYLNSGKIEYRGDVPTVEPVDYYSILAYAIDMCYAYRATSTGIGLSTRYIDEYIFGENEAHYVFNFGVVHSPVKNLTLGVCLENIGFYRGTPAPLKLTAGLAYKFKNLAIIFDIYKSIDTYVRESIGLEFIPNPYFVLRMGYKHNYDSERFSTGFGVSFKNFVLNYAFVPYFYNLGNAHTVSVDLLFK